MAENAPKFNIIQYTRPDCKSIRMDLKMLEAFCRNRRLPVFVLNANEIEIMGKKSKIEDPYIEYFTLYDGWVLYARTQDSKTIGPYSDHVYPQELPETE